MDAIVTAGGIPLPEEPLYAATQGHPKALLDIAGKPMIQWVLDALCEAKTVDRVILVGLTEKSGLTCGKEVFYIPNQGKMVENWQAGARKALELNPKARQVLMVSSDIPALRGEMVDWVTTNAMQTDDDVYYHIIERSVMEKRFPGSKRTWTRLKDMEVCGADLNVARLKFLAGGERGIWDKILDARKSPMKQATLVGFDTAMLLLTGQLTLEKAVANVSARLKVAGRAVVCPYAEIGMDVDKPNQLEIMRADLAKRVRAEERKSAVAKDPRRRPAKKAGARKVAVVKASRISRAKKAAVRKPPAAKASRTSHAKKAAVKTFRKPSTKIRRAAGRPSAKKTSKK